MNIRESIEKILTNLSERNFVNLWVTWQNHFGECRFMKNDPEKIVEKMGAFDAFNALLASEGKYTLKEEWVDIKAGNTFSDCLISYSTTELFEKIQIREDVLFNKETQTFYSDKRNIDLIKELTDAIESSFEIGEDWFKEQVKL